jgi:peptidoglycan/LPS O-acetylase OafA/YrhL
VELVTGTEMIMPSRFKAVFAVMGAVLMFLILAAPGTLLSRIFSFTPLRAIGIVGYSYYLLHPLVIEALMDFSMQYFNYPLLHGRLFVATSLVTWLVCLFTYSLIERPFLVKRKQDS